MTASPTARSVTDPAIEQLLRDRYGLDRNPWPRRLIVAGVVAGFGVALVLVGSLLVTRSPIEGNMLGWQANERAATFQLELRGSSADPVTCVVKAQDSTSTDIGYRTFEIPRSPASVELSLPTLFRASSVQVLGCAPAGEPLRVAPPDFPPGVAIP